MSQKLSPRFNFFFNRLPHSHSFFVSNEIYNLVVKLIKLKIAVFVMRKEHKNDLELRY